MVDDPRLAAQILCSLHGVQVRMASAILTVYNPDIYTVMDVRAWATLKRIGLESVGLAEYSAADLELNKVDMYHAYLSACRKLALQYNVNLRTLDRYLWKCNGNESKQDED